MSVTSMNTAQGMMTREHVKNRPLGHVGVGIQTDKKIFTIVGIKKGT
jgi:hypothetical protein